jgi:hypothetical protein
MARLGVRPMLDYVRLNIVARRSGHHTARTPSTVRTKT